VKFAKYVVLHKCVLSMLNSVFDNEGRNECDSCRGVACVVLVCIYLRLDDRDVCRLS
jgi:hypothetical protein